MIIQFFLSACFLIALALTWRRFHERVIRLAEACSWSLVWAVALLVVTRPELTSVLAHAVGIGRGADLILYCAIPLLFWLIFRIFLRIDAAERRFTDLVRRHALDRFEAEVAVKQKKGQDA